MSTSSDHPIYKDMAELRADCGFMATLPHVQAKGYTSPELIYYTYMAVGAWRMGESVPEIIESVAPTTRNSSQGPRLILISGVDFLMSRALRTEDIRYSLTSEGEGEGLIVRGRMSRWSNGVEVAFHEAEASYSWAHPLFIKKANSHSPWRSHPKQMLEKTVISWLLRKVAPRAVKGLYSGEEMGHVIPQPQHIQKQIMAQPITIDSAPAPAIEHEHEDSPASVQAVEPGWLGRDQPLTKEEWDKITEPLTPEQLDAVAHLPYRANQLACLFDGSGRAYPAETPIEERAYWGSLELFRLPEGAYIMNGFNAMGGQAFNGPVTQTAIDEYLADPGWLNAERVLSSLLNESCHAPKENNRGVHVGRSKASPDEGDQSSLF